MKKTTLIIPRAGLKLRDPKTGKPIPAEGILVRGPLDNFWHRRLKDGDVSIATEE